METFSEPSRKIGDAIRANRLRTVIWKGIWKQGTSAGRSWWFLKCGMRGRAEDSSPLSKTPSLSLLFLFFAPSFGLRSACPKGVDVAFSLASLMTIFL